MTTPYSARRQHPRFNVDIKVAVSVESVRFDARTRDMSRAGVCLVAVQPIPRETEISLELVLTFGDDRHLGAAHRHRTRGVVHGAVRRVPDRREVREGRRRHARATWTCSWASWTARWPPEAWGRTRRS